MGKALLEAGIRTSEENVGPKLRDATKGAHTIARPMPFCHIRPQGSRSHRSYHTVILNNERDAFHKIGRNGKGHDMVASVGYVEHTETLGISLKFTAPNTPLFDFEDSVTPSRFAFFKSCNSKMPLV